MPDTFIYDLSVKDSAIDSDDGLRTAITISLFSDARAQAGMTVPDPTDLRGWWGDSYADTPGDVFGSRIWTLIGEKVTPNLLVQLDELIREALQWLIDDGLVSGIEVELEILAPGVVGAKIGVLRPGASTVAPLGLWEVSLNG